jgi:hypothetical protein
MSPAHPHAFPADAGIRCVCNPSWAVGRDPDTGTRILSVRDPRFGWLCFALQPDEFDTLGRSLADEA